MMKKLKSPYLGKVYPISSALMFALIASQQTSASTINFKTLISINENQQKITGSVISEGTPLAGVTVSIKERPSTTTVTDSNGKFSISASLGETLVFKRIGFNTIEKQVSSDVLQITLTATEESIEEVVIVGFGTQKKANLTGAVQAISAKDLQDRPITNASTAMQGKFAGVTITQNSGQPGKDGGTIRIRGLGTINNSNPLVIVDGIESSLNNINPNDIENISVLKDGPSAAIYGSKAANGVILVTTKKR